MKYTTYECDLCHKKYSRHQDNDTIDDDLLGLTIVDHPKAKRIFQTSPINDASIHICVGCVNDLSKLKIAVPAHMQISMPKGEAHDAASINALRIKNGIAPIKGGESNDH